MRAQLTAFIATPAPAGSTSGNRITALRWAKRLRELGRRVQVESAWDGEPCDLLVALHAVKSHASIARHARDVPDGARVVVLTGTDVYAEPLDELTTRSLALATRIVVLQPEAIARVPPQHRARVHVIRQSAVAAPRVAAHGPTACVLAHLRDVKDPLLAARAVGLLPTDSLIRIVHLGAADEAWHARACAAELATAGRWRWLGPLRRACALAVLATSELLVLTSVSEGGANVVTEAIAAGVPVLSTRIEGSLGILGDDYPGYFEVGDARGLADLLLRYELDGSFASDLRRRIASLHALVAPATEREAWRTLLRALAGRPSRRRRPGREPDVDEGVGSRAHGAHPPAPADDEPDDN